MLNQLNKLKAEILWIDFLATERGYETVEEGRKLKDLYQEVVVLEEESELVRREGQSE